MFPNRSVESLLKVRSSQRITDAIWGNPPSRHPKWRFAAVEAPSGGVAPKPPSMRYAEALRQTRSRADQEAHAPFYVQHEVIEKTFQSEVHPKANVFADVINQEIEKVNSHVVACLGVLESASPTSDSELVRCSAECGSMVTFIHCNRNAMRELAKEFEEKMLRTTC